MAPHTLRDNAERAVIVSKANEEALRQNCIDDIKSQLIPKSQMSNESASDLMVIVDNKKQEEMLKQIIVDFNESHSTDSPHQ